MSFLKTSAGDFLTYAGSVAAAILALFGGYYQHVNGLDAVAITVIVLMLIITCLTIAPIHKR